MRNLIIVTLTALLLVIIFAIGLLSYINYNPEKFVSKIINVDIKIIYKDTDIKIIKIGYGYFAMPINGGTLSPINRFTGQNVEKKYLDSLQYQERK